MIRILTYRARILEKVGRKNSGELARYAIRNRLVGWPDPTLLESRSRDLGLA